jgi:hypothetical protein
MSSRIQESIDRYLRGEAELDEALAALQEYMDSNESTGLSMGTAGLSPEQRNRLEILVGRFQAIKSQEAKRLIDEARKAGREVAEIHFTKAERENKKRWDIS